MRKNNAYKLAGARALHRQRGLVDRLGQLPVQREHRRRFNGQRRCDYTSILGIDRLKLGDIGGDTANGNKGEGDNLQWVVTGIEHGQVELDTNAALGIQRHRRRDSAAQQVAAHTDSRRPDPTVGEPAAAIRRITKERFVPCRDCFTLDHSVC